MSLNESARGARSGSSLASSRVSSRPAARAPGRLADPDQRPQRPPARPPADAAPARVVTSDAPKQRDAERLERVLQLVERHDLEVGAVDGFERHADGQLRSRRCTGSACGLGCPDCTSSLRSAGRSSPLNSALSGYQVPSSSSTGLEPVGVTSDETSPSGSLTSDSNWLLHVLGVRVRLGRWRPTRAGRAGSRRVSPMVAPASTTDRSRAPTAKARVMRARSPSRGRKRLTGPGIRPGACSPGRAR